MDWGLRNRLSRILNPQDGKGGKIRGSKKDH